MTAMTLVLTLLIAPLFLAVCLWRRSVALAVFCALLPAYLVRFALPLPGLALPSTLLEVLFWELFLAWAFTDGNEPGAWSALAEWSEPITLFVVGATVGVLVSPDLRAALGLWRAYVLEPILFFPMFVAVVAKERRGPWVLGALGGLTAAIGVTAVYQKLTGFGIPAPWQEAAARRVTSVFGFPNAIGLFCAPMVVLLAGWTIALLRARELRHRLLAALPAAAALLGAFAILFAVSEGGAIGAAAGLFALGLFDKKLRGPALGALILACVVFIAWRPATDYASYILSLRDDSGSVRRIIWDETSKMLRDNPVFGAGLSGYPGRIAPYHKADWIEIFMYPHDIVLNFWSETGLLGLAGFAWIAGRFFVRSWRYGRKSWIVPAAAAAMITMLVHGLVDVPYFKNDLAFLFWAVVGMVESVRRVSEESVLEKTRDALAGRPGTPWLT